MDSSKHKMKDLYHMINPLLHLDRLIGDLAITIFNQHWLACPDPGSFRADT